LDIPSIDEKQKII